MRAAAGLLLLGVGLAFVGFCLHEGDAAGEDLDGPRLGGTAPAGRGIESLTENRRPWERSVDRGDSLARGEPVDALLTAASGSREPLAVGAGP